MLDFAEYVEYMYQSDKNFESHCNYNNIFMNVIDVANSDENEVVYYK